MLTKAYLLTLSMICRQLLHSRIHVKTDLLHSFRAVLIYAHTSTDMLLLPPAACFEQVWYIVHTHCFCVHVNCFLTGIVDIADNALESLRGMRAGMKADKVVDRKKIRKEMSNLYRAKRQKIEKQVAWHHKFVCLAYRNQERIPTVDAEKEELYQAGLFRGKRNCI